MWKSLRFNSGKCTYYPNEFRGGKNSPIAEVFNLLNDINNLYLSNDRNKKLQGETKKYIFNEIDKSFNVKDIEKAKKINVNLKLISKCLNHNNSNQNELEYSIDNIYGYRKNNDKEEFTELKNWFSICKWMILNRIVDKVSITDLHVLNKANDIFVLLSRHKDVFKQLEVLEQSFPNSNNEYNKKLLHDLKGLSATHSLSYKAMNHYIEYCFKNLDHSINQMVYFNINKKNDIDSLNNQKYFKKGLYDDEIISPTTRRAFNQCIAIMNKILKLYAFDFEIDNITFELARDKNSAEERKSIERSQKQNKKIIDEICSEEQINKDSLNSQQRERLKLWKEQNGIDIYDGEEISISDVLSGNGLNVDHIIPFSISAMNSMSNKVLTKAYLNKDKSNKTPYQWLDSKGQYEKFKDRVLKTFISDKKNKNKIDNLLFELDPLKNIDGFIERNLVDTRYASRIVLNTFQDFFKNNSNYPEAKIKVINGSLTNFARYQLFKKNNKPYLHKDRDLYCHHAIDASIVAFLGMNHQIKLLTSYWNNKQRNFDTRLTIDHDSKQLIDEKTGEEYMKAVSSKFKSLNGNIVVTSNKDGVNVLCSNDNRVLKDTDWFNMDITLNGVTRKMRTWPSYGV